MASNAQVWVGCVACYSAGRLVGDWYPAIDAADLTVTDVHDNKPCPCEYSGELHCYDSEGLGVGECGPIEASQRAEVLEGHDNPEALLAYAGHTGLDLAVAAREFDDAFQGEHDSGEDFAGELYQDLGELRGVSHALACHIDWRGVWRDLECEGYFSAPADGGGVYIFRSV